MATRKSGERITVSAIRETYFIGDYEACLGMCDAFKQRDAKDMAELVLLRARCLVALRRGDHAIDVLRGLKLSDDQHDEYLTGRMLMSAAYLSLGRLEEGIKIAREAYGEIGAAHATVRSEVTLNLALAHYRKEEYGPASRLLDEVSEANDIVYVRALQLRGAVAWAYRDFTGSSSAFHEALARLDQCQYYDRFLEANLLFSLACLCGEVPRLDLWPDLAKRIEQFNWSASGVVIPHYWIAIEASFITEMLGDLSASTSWARRAERVAFDPASLVGAWLRLAARFERNGEKGAHEYFTSKAMCEYDDSARDARLEEHWPLSLDIAEEMLHSSDPGSASRFVTYYTEVIVPHVRRVKTEGRSLESRYATVLGLLEERRGNRARAEEAYRRAFDIGCATGLMRNTAIVAYRLFALTGEKQYEDFISGVLRGASDKYWVKARLARSRTEARLTPRQLAVLRLVARGLTDKEIGRTLGISYARARNIVAEARKLLGVRSRAELVTVAAARGLLEG